ncbi:MAG: hypothetical protein K2Y37_00805 [Pirellulales bacterium]|nr:hypothetical protein [Pirellulales bacterium]
MNLEHLRAFFWLRWRLLVNQWQRGGRVNAVLMIVLLVGAIALAVPSFVLSLGLGVFGLDRAEPNHLLYIWDGIVVAFLFFWSLGLLTDLQRAETFALSKFLHLPVPLSGAFLINYLGTLLRISLVIFVPVTLGLALGLSIRHGLWSAVPLVAAFFLMITALTYQLQGWLASLMSNPRRRRAIVVTVTAVFVLIFQLPNLLRFIRPGGLQQRAERSNQMLAEMKALERQFEAKEIDAAEQVRRQNEVIERYQADSAEAKRQSEARWERYAKLVNVVLPVGWLPLGIMTTAQGRIVPPLLALAGMSLIGGGSLWCAYRTTIGIYQGRFTARPASSTTVAVAAADAGTPASSRSARLLEMRLPLVSEPAAAVALAGFRALLRAPESKMMLLTPLVLGVMFGSAVFRSPAEGPLALRALTGIGAIGLGLFGTLQTMANQFGFDRDGFRVYVLSAVPRRSILLGKNLANLPITLGIAVLTLVIVEIARPLRLDHLAAMVPQFVSMFLLFCLLMNLLSIFAPLPIAAGSLKPAQTKLTPALLQFLMFATLFPLTQVFTLLPLGIEALVHWQGIARGVPIYLLLSLVQCAAVLLAYRLAIALEGDWLQAREQKILEVVTSKVP